MRQTKIIDYKVIVEVRRYGSGNIPQIKTDCDQIVSEIERHVDNVSSVYTDSEEEETCTFCGGIWTENSDNYNGGCCHKDEENNPEIEDKYDL